MTETSSRLLELLSLLQGRRDWQGAELADRLDVSRRTIRRDVERLRDLGYPVESLTGPSGGYRLRAGTAMPPLLLDDDEAIAIAVGLGTAARASVTGIERPRSGARQLEQVLPVHLRRRVRALGSATIAPPVGGPTVDPQHLTVIAAACRDSECLRFAYRTATVPRAAGRWASLAGPPRPPLVSGCLGPPPRGLAQLSRRPADRAGLQRRALRAAQASGQGPGDVCRAGITRAPTRFEATVTLHAAAEEIESRVPHYWGTIEPIDERTCRYRTGDDELGWLAIRIAMLDVDFEVHEPPELGERLGALATSSGEPLLGPMASASLTAATTASYANRRPGYDRQWRCDRTSSCRDEAPSRGTSWESCSRLSAIRMSS